MTQRENRIFSEKVSQEREPALAGAKPAGGDEAACGQAIPAAWSRGDAIALFLVVLGAALLRFVNLNYMAFRADEANNLFAAAGLAFGKTFPLVGIPSSIGTYTPPFFVYLMTIPLLLSRNPVIAAGFVALLNCAAVGLCYVFCRRYFGRTVAITAAAFFAVNPWAVFYSRKIWQQDALPLFVIGFFFSIFAVVCEGRRRQLLACFACLAAITQLHMSSVYYAVVLLIVLAWFRPRVGWRIYAGGIAIALLSYAPYLAFDLLHGGYDAKVYLHAFSAPSHFHGDALIAPLQLASTLGFMHYADIAPLDLFQDLFLVMGLVYLLSRLNDRRYAILFLWFSVPVGFLLFGNVALYPHYFICLYPIQFVIVGVMAHALMNDPHSRSRILHYATLTLLVLLICYQFSSSLKFVSSIASQKQLAWPGFGQDYGPPFHFRVREIRGLVQSGIVAPEAVQKHLVESKSSSATAGYDFPATEYIVENLKVLP
jgi:4-amino-4-deoxy-L-arabinose transferase-like glycosyltransferase